MGLLGGFKGKLIGKEKKQKKTTNSRVVCVKFHTFSEFDASPNDLPSCSNANLGRNDVIKERKQPTKAEIKSVFENRGLRANGDLPKAPTNATTAFETVPAKAVTAPAKVETAPTKVETTPAKVETTPAKVEITAPKAKAPAPRAETTAPKAKAPTPKAERTTFKAKAPSPIAEIAAPKPATRVAKAEPSPAPRTPTARQQAPKPPAPRAPEDGGGSKSRAPPQPSFQIDDEEEEDGNFKIHFVDNIGHNFTEESDDESWAENDGRSSPVNYSSQATSIFFGEEEEPTIVRPRNVVFHGGDDDDDDDDDDDSVSNGSSASA